MQRQEYNSRFAVSQSAIKEFRFKSPKRWKDIWVDRQLDLDREKEAFTFGSLVDTILFTPQLIDKRFYIANDNSVPPEAVEKIVRNVYENSALSPRLIEVEDDFLPIITKVEVYDLNDYKREILDACNKYEWSGHWKDDTRVNKIIEKGQHYFELLAKAEGRKVISSEMNFEAISVVSKLQKDEYVGKYFTNSNDFTNVFQLELFNKYVSNDHYEVPLKCAIDILHIDRKMGTLRVCDFKTSHSAHNFIQSIKQFGYCDQLSFYTYMLKLELTKQPFREMLGLTPEREWTILEPLNIVISESEQVPYVYEYEWKDIDLARTGNSEYLFELYRTNDHASRIKKGWKELLEEICWHMQNDQWDYPVEFYKTGKIKVSLLNS